MKYEIKEQMAGFDDSRLDRNGKVVYGVSILRSTSQNGRVYLPEAMENVRDLIEGKKSYANHAPMMASDEVRPVQDLLGYFSESRIEDNVVRANLHYLPTYAKLIEGIIELNPALAAFSIHAYSSDVVRRSDGLQEVRDMKSVESVDLVTEAAATTSMFESRQNMKKDQDTIFEMDMARAVGIVYKPEIRLDPWEAKMIEATGMKANLEKEAREDPGDWERKMEIAIQS